MPAGASERATFISGDFYLCPLKRRVPMPLGCWKRSNETCHPPSLTSLSLPRSRAHTVANKLHQLYGGTFFNSVTTKNEKRHSTLPRHTQYTEYYLVQLKGDVFTLLRNTFRRLECRLRYLT